MRRRDLLSGLWKRVEEHRAELQAERIAPRKRERVDPLDAGGTVQLPKYDHGEASPSGENSGVAPQNEPDK